MVVDDKEGVTAKIEKAGGTFFMELPGDYPGVDAETKFKDPNGIVFDVSEHEWTLKRKA
jgi:hypothetical protein